MFHGLEQVLQEELGSERAPGARFLRHAFAAELSEPKRHFLLETSRVEITQLFEDMFFVPCWQAAAVVVL